MLDLAELFEVVAYPAKATRRVHTKDHGDPGREYGPFYEFARAVWVQVFGSEAGLPAAIRRWSSRRRSGTRSSVIAKIAARYRSGETDPDHPVWWLYEQNYANTRHMMPLESGGVSS